ncbi:MAG: hypothetical protein AAF456_08715 [Planctomycetota bacterium]
MKRQKVYFVGSSAEVAHHAAPVIEASESSGFDLEIVEPAAAIDRIHHGDLAVFYSEHFDRFRQTCKELKSRNIPTLYMIDGILEWRNAWENRPDEPACPWTMRPVLSHKVACIGHSQARTLAAWGNGSKIEITGIPRLDNLTNRWKELDTGTDPRQSVHPFRILIMTAKFPGFTEQQVENTKRALTDVKKFVEACPEIGGRKVELIWRLTRGMDETIGVDNQLTDLCGTDLANVLKSVDAVVTTPSTAMLEAMLLRLPVALLEYNNNPHYIPAAWHIGNQSQIAPVFEGLVAGDATRMQFQNDVLRDSLLIEPASTATDRLVELIKGMLKVADLADGNELHFPAAMLGMPLTIEGEFNHQSIYAGYAGFDTTDVAELQSQEAHSRRVIDSLRAEINQLESELSEAHRIFDQIHDHPIAGPVVRARQRVLDWLARFNQREDTRQ